MIKTLRITSILAAILAGVLIKFFVFPVIFDVSGDENVEKVLDSAGVIEQFKNTEGKRAKSTGNQVAPLVKQAEAFARYLAPKPKAKRTVSGLKTTGKPSLAPVKPKFQVFATSYFEGNPELSQALIDEPGKGRHWVRQSTMVGHLLIEQVKDGMVIVKSSEETFELAIEKTSAATSPKSPARGSTSTGKRSPYSRTQSVTGRTAPGVTKTASKPPAPQRNAVASEKTDALIERLKDLRRSYRSDRSSSGLNGEESGEERAARIDELISKVKSTRVSTEDAKNLTSLGERLKDSSQDPNRSTPASNTGKVETSSGKPEK
ncbi:MAG: hypothetical protein CEE38_03390 [Planctomycetes bacterium B3_Pla]|nr:MAG: hypothetical protein CEE38_03390 [Planctomycetes bacterium B3_Pla]